jgi:hypothetical protein
LTWQDALLAKSLQGKGKSAAYHGVNWSNGPEAPIFGSKSEPRTASSAVEHRVDIAGATGSIPVPSTTSPPANSAPSRSPFCRTATIRPSARHSPNIPAARRSMDRSGPRRHSLPYRQPPAAPSRHSAGRRSAGSTAQSPQHHTPFIERGAQLLHRGGLNPAARLLSDDHHLIHPSQLGHRVDAEPQQRPGHTKLIRRHRASVAISANANMLLCLYREHRRSHTKLAHPGGDLWEDGVEFRGSSIMGKGRRFEIAGDEESRNASAACAQFIVI